MSLTRFIAAAALVFALFGALGLAPEPDPVPTRWQLDVTPGPLRVISLTADGERGAYLYFTYSVTNNTGEDLEFVPSFEMATDGGKVIPSGSGVDPRVTDALLARLEHPFLQDQIDILGPIQQGPENAKHGLVIWPLDSFTADEVRVFGAGFSGETDAIELLDTETGEMKRLVFRKTLMMRFATPGEIRVDLLGSRPFDVVERRWIMR